MQDQLLSSRKDFLVPRAVTVTAGCALGVPAAFLDSPSPPPKDLRYQGGSSEAVLPRPRDSRQERGRLVLVSHFGGMLLLELSLLLLLDYVIYYFFFIDNYFSLMSLVLLRSAFRRLPFLPPFPPAAAFFQGRPSILPEGHSYPIAS